MFLARIILGSIAVVACIFGFLVSRGESGALSVKLFTLSLIAAAFFVYPNHIVESFRTAPRVNIVVWSSLGALVLILFLLIAYANPVIDFVHSVFDSPSKKR